MTITLQLTVDYDATVTDEDSVVEALNLLLANALDTPDILQ
jgi:hypothetical protein